jgi:hypothetical protein
MFGTPRHLLGGRRSTVFVLRLGVFAAYAISLRTSFNNCRTSKN